MVSGKTILLSVVGDSDVRANDTEVGKGTPLTSPFIEGIYGKDRSALLYFPQIPRLHAFGVPLGMTF